MSTDPDRPDTSPATLQPGEFVLRRVSGPVKVSEGMIDVAAPAYAAAGVATLKALNGMADVWTYELRPDLALFIRIRALVGGEYPTRIEVDGRVWEPAEIDQAAKHVKYRPASG